MIPRVKDESTSKMPLCTTTTEAVWERPSLQRPAILSDGVRGYSEVTRAHINVWSG